MQHAATLTTRVLLRSGCGDRSILCGPQNAAAHSYRTFTINIRNFRKKYIFNSLCFNFKLFCVVMSETIVGVTENFQINLEVLSAHFMHFYFWAKNCQKQPTNSKSQPKYLRTASFQRRSKNNLNRCGPHAGRTACGESPQPEPKLLYIYEFI